ncbi:MULTISPECIES: hypothetical protein [unclassified Bradyrhizobium]
MFGPAIPARDYRSGNPIPARACPGKDALAPPIAAWVASASRSVAAKRRREERQDAIEAGEVAQLALIRRDLEQMLLGVRNRLLNLPGETAYALAMRPQAECYEVLDGAVRAALEEIADPAGAAAAGIKSRDVEVKGRCDIDEEEDDSADVA